MKVCAKESDHKFLRILKREEKAYPGELTEIEVRWCRVCGTVFADKRFVELGRGKISIKRIVLTPSFSKPNFKSVRRKFLVM